MIENGLRPRSCWLEIDLDALERNLSYIEETLPGRQSVLAVVKAEAYGHGAEIVAEVLENAGIKIFGVATLEEAIKLREHGINASILIMGHMATYNVSELFKYNLTPMIYSYRLLQAIAEEARNQEKVKDVHLKIDTGMGRLGLRVKDVLRFAQKIKTYQSVHLAGLATHFPEAGENPDYTENQIEQMETITDTLRDHDFDPQWVHSMNSAAVFSEDRFHGNLVRPGISLYGYSPLAEPIQGLEPVLQARCKMADYKKVEPGHGVSYGREWVPDQPTWLGVLPIGYADGYSRVLSRKAHVLKNGEKRPVLGNICMDMTIIQCYKDDDPEQTVTLLGRDGNQELWADQLANWNGTIPYEILSRFSARWPRLYFKNDQLIALKSEQGIEQFDPPRSRSEVIQ